jgi:hypothetical protein
MDFSLGPPARDCFFISDRYKLRKGFIM